MKIFFTAFIALLFVKTVSAQKDLLSFDEHNKYIYYQVVDMPGFSVDSLEKHVAYFVKKSYPKNKTVQHTKSEGFTFKDKFLTYASFVKHESGEIDFTLNIECKDQKYRYWITNFVFTPYERDRYGNYVPKQGIDIPLENISSKYDKKESDGYLDQAGAFCKQLSANLKLYMVDAPAPKKEEIVKKVVTDKW